MAPLGPWPPSGGSAPIAVAASGGADSAALAWLAARWTVRRRLPLLALVVDHGLRLASAAEAAATCDALRRSGISARLLRLDGLMPGTALPERARIARYEALANACAAAGAVDLLLGHHADDQAETVLMRQRAGSRADGMAGMAYLVETDRLRLLRPLLGVAPSRLRLTLAAAATGWIEDPSNRDLRLQRPRLRRELAAAPAQAARLLVASQRHGIDRMERQIALAATLAASVELHPEGYALLLPELLPPEALAMLIRTVGGASYQPPRDAVERLCRQPHPCTLAGTRLLRAGRLGPGWLLLREAAAAASAIPARQGALWDRRYRLHAPAPMPDGFEVSALGPERPPGTVSPLPASVLAPLPAIRRRGALLAVPHLGWAADPALTEVEFRLQPPVPAAAPGLFTGA